MNWIKFSLSLNESILVRDDKIELIQSKGPNWSEITLTNGSTLLLAESIDKVADKLKMARHAGKTIPACYCGPKQ